MVKFSAQVKNGSLWLGFELTTDWLRVRQSTHCTRSPLDWINNCHNSLQVIILIPYTVSQFSAQPSTCQIITSNYLQVLTTSQTVSKVKPELTAW